MTTTFSTLAATLVAQQCVLLADVMNMHMASVNALSLRPDPLPGSDLEKDWQILGHLIADQNAGSETPECLHTVFFGVLAQSRSNQNAYAVIIRGTYGWREWVENAKVGKTRFPTRGYCIPGAMVCHPERDCGMVEEGFYNMYSSMRYLAADGSPAVTAWKGIAKALEHNPVAFVSVAGHSMGAALATYLTFDLQTLANRTAWGMFIASPKTGNGDFVEAFHEAVPTYAVYEYVRDIVPDMPPSLLGYRTLPNLIQLTPVTSEASIKDEVRSNHHTLCYAAMMDYGLKTQQEWEYLLWANACEADCIQGPATQEQKYAA